MKWLSTFLFILLVIGPGITLAKYQSEVDDLVTVRSVSILPVLDNVQGIYSRAIENYMIETFSEHHQFEYVRANTTGPILSPQAIHENAESAQKISSQLNADSFIATQILKGPRGIQVKMGLFLTKDAKQIAYQELNDHPRQDLDSLKKEVDVLMTKLFSQLPFSGVVMSRKGTRVTVNIGRKDGATQDQVISIVQIIKLRRHPKFNFLVSTEKEILGKVKLLKVEPTLSFGRVITEKETDAIQANSKIDRLDSVFYGDADSLSENAPIQEQLKQSEGSINFGDNPKEWLPTKTPTFGAVGARAGLGTYTDRLTRTGDSLEADAPYYPFIVLEGELWLTPHWTLHAGIRQGIITTDQPLSGASPSELSHRVSSYEFLVGYTLRLGPGLHSPKVEILGGYGTYDMYVDDSEPDSLTSRTYSGMKLGVSGSYNLSEGSKYSLGANLYLFYDANMSESPNVSGSSDSDITQFGLFLDQALKINLKARYQLDFEQYNSKFSGGTATSSSQKHTTLSAGIYYMF